jgi:hypothetical protein
VNFVEMFNEGLNKIHWTQGVAKVQSKLFTPAATIVERIAAVSQMAFAYYAQ